jgi:hypothetical protein
LTFWCRGSARRAVLRRGAAAAVGFDVHRGRDAGELHQGRHQNPVVLQLVPRVQIHFEPPHVDGPVPQGALRERRPHGRRCLQFGFNFFF